MRIFNDLPPGTSPQDIEDAFGENDPAMFSGQDIDDNTPIHLQPAYQRNSGPALDRDQELEEAIEHMMTMEGLFVEAVSKAATAESVYRLDFSDAFLLAQGTEKVRNAEALLRVREQLTMRNDTEATREYTFQKLKNSQTAVTARQSLLNANVRTNRAVS